MILIAKRNDKMLIKLMTLKKFDDNVKKKLMFLYTTRRNFIKILR